jgi:hypothetical protein
MSMLATPTRRPWFSIVVAAADVGCAILLTCKRIAIVLLWVEAIHRVSDGFTEGSR